MEITQNCPTNRKRRRSSDQKSSEVQKKRKNFGQKAPSKKDGQRKRKRDEQGSDQSAGEETPTTMGRHGSVLMSANILLHHIYYGLFPLRRPRSKKSSSSPPKKKMKTSKVSNTVSQVVSEAVEETVEQAVEEVVSLNAPAGLTLASFNFHKILGEGGFGRVTLATHVATGRQVEVKVVPKSLLVGLDSNTILLERQILEKVRTSPFFTHAYGTFQTEDDLFFVMEYLSGGDLYNFIHGGGGPFTTEAKRFICAEILCGMQRLHNLGIIHRDLKPENILLDSNGHVKIADFGLSQINMFGSKMAYSDVGTPIYKAPEVELGRPYNTASDYYSFGVIAFEMATRLHCKYVNCRKFCYPSNTDPHLKDLIERLLTKCPKMRSKAVKNLRKHPFFKPINWKKLNAGKAVPPYSLPTV